MANNTKRGGAGNFAEDPQRASEAGKAGAEKTHDGSQKLNPTKQGAERSPGNFANNHEKASEAGRKGGKHSHIGSQHH